MKSTEAVIELEAKDLLKIDMFSPEIEEIVNLRIKIHALDDIVNRYINTYQEEPEKLDAILWDLRTEYEKKISNLLEEINRNEQ